MLKVIFKVTFANLFTNYQASHFSLYIKRRGIFQIVQLHFFQVLVVRVQGVCPKFRRKTEGGRIFEVTSAFED